MLKLVPNMNKFLLIAILATSLVGCIEKKVRDLESPCVANEFSDSMPDAIQNPCIRRSANQWLI